MQADISHALTLKGRQFFAGPLALMLGAALAGFAVFLVLQLAQGHAMPETSPQGSAERAAHPWGVLVHISPEAAPSPARTPLAQFHWLPAPGPVIEAVPESQLALREAAPTSDPPLPPRRPSADRAANARRAMPAIGTAPVADTRGLFARLFSIQPGDSPALAYANPQDGVVSGTTRTLMGYADGRTAVYDISARAVTMPNGEKLEAHSGLGDLLDDPNRVHIKNRGSTPPNVYELSLRERLFHGVRALRLNPVHGGDMYGRDGMLAHTYMLGPKGDSNGCVSFKDYERFLRAYLNGEVKRLIVVQRQA